MNEIEPGVIIAFIVGSVFLISLLSDFLFGKKDGPFESYYRSGQLKKRGTYKDGELEGLCEEYYKNGQLSEKGIYKDGEPHGPFEGYSKNGQLEWKGTYNMGEECGEWVEDGDLWVTYDPCPPDLQELSEQRLKKLKDFAEQMGMEFSAKGDSALLESLSAFDLFSQSGVKITNVLHGDSEQLGYGEDFEVRILEHIYSSDDSTISQTVIYFRSPQLSLPDFSMRPEHFFHKIGSVLGYQDIDFESHPTAVEFSKKYLLRGKDEQKIRALFTDKVLTFFAAHPSVGNGHLPFWHWSQYEVCVEGSGDQLILYRAGIGIKPEDIPTFMKEGFEVFRVFT